MPSWVMLGIMRTNIIDIQEVDNSTVDWLPISSVLCIFGSSRYPESYMHFAYPIKKLHDGFYAVENVF